MPGRRLCTGKALQEAGYAASSSIHSHRLPQANPGGQQPPVVPLFFVDTRRPHKEKRPAEAERKPVSCHTFGYEKRGAMSWATASEKEEAYCRKSSNRLAASWD